MIINTTILEEGRGSGRSTKSPKQVPKNIFNFYQII